MYICINDIHVHACTYKIMVKQTNKTVHVHVLNNLSFFSVCPVYDPTGSMSSYDLHVQYTVDQSNRKVNSIHTVVDHVQCHTVVDHVQYIQ